MNNGGDNNYWQPNPANDPFAPVQADPQTQPAAAAAPLVDQTIQDPPVVSEPAAQPGIEASEQVVAAAEVSDANVSEEANSEFIADDRDTIEVPAFEPIRWSSSTTISYEHGANWNLALFGIAGLIIAVIIGISIWQQNFSFSNISIIGLVIVVVIAILAVSKKPATESSYMLTESGLTIDNQLHPFSEFRAFGVHKEGALWQLTLIPTRRFGAAVNAFIDSDQGEKIVDILGSRLPMEKVTTHPIDKLARLLKL